MRIRVQLVLVMGLLLSSIPAPAQGTGVIRGRVVTPDHSGEGAEVRSVEGATVFLPETQEFAVTDADGNYEFTGLEPGLYNVTVGAPKLGGTTRDVWLYRTGEEKGVEIELRGRVVPKIGDDLGEFSRGWYLKHLKVLKEPFFCDGDNKSDNDEYRFLWLRTFDNPIHIRLQIQDDGTGAVTVKRTKGQGGYDPGKLAKTKILKVSSAMVGVFLEFVERAEFWNLPSTFEPGVETADGTVAQTVGLDGAQWIIEGRSQGRCHYTDRWSPEEGEYRSLGLLFLTYIANLDFPLSEVY